MKYNDIVMITSPNFMQLAMGSKIRVRWDNVLSGPKSESPDNRNVHLVKILKAVADNCVGIYWAELIKK